MKKYTFLCLLMLTTTFTCILQSMHPKNENNTIPYSRMINHKNNLYVTDESIHDFNEQKMLSTGSLDALAHLKEQNVIVSLDDLENQGYKIVKPQACWRRWGGAFRRYATTFCVIGTATMVSILAYYLYTAKSDVKKVSSIVDEAQEAFKLIKNIIPDAKITLQLAKAFFNCSVPSVNFIEDLIEARNKLCKNCP